jgi:hypothetical protein
VGFRAIETALQTGTATPVPTNPNGSFNTTGGTLTFGVDVTGDDSLFLRIQDAALGS